MIIQWRSEEEAAWYVDEGSRLAGRLPSWHGSVLLNTVETRDSNIARPMSMPGFLPSAPYNPRCVDSDAQHTLSPHDPLHEVSRWRTSCVCPLESLLRGAIQVLTQLGLTLFGSQD